MTSLVLLLLHVLLMPSSVSSSTYWYYGGAQTITPKGAEGTYEVELRNKQTTYRCNVNPYRCAYGNCGAAIQSVSTMTAWDSFSRRWCQKETKTRLRLNSNLPFEIRYPTSSSYHRQGYWYRDYKNRYTPWRMMVHVDLGTRSDTKQSNRPPVSTMLPIVRVTRNCPRTFNLNMFDPDGDRVRCKVATNSSNYECGRCRYQPGISLDQDSCSVTYKYGRHGNIPIELVIEDFPKKNILLAYSDGSYTLKQPFSLQRGKRQTTTAVNKLPEAVQTALRADTNSKFINGKLINPQNYRPSIPPLSKLPLQFIVHVDSHYAPTCREGHYFPVFLSPTPANGAHLPAFVNKILEIRIKATALYTRIYKVLVTGPSGISSKKIATGDYVIRWTPTDSEFNDHFPVCFVAEALNWHRRVFHSDLRCLTVDVGHYDAVVTCKETTMMVEVKKTYLLRQNEDSLHLLSSDTSSECNLKTLSNSTHLVAVMSLASCGTYVEEDQDNIHYKNKITSADPNTAISRKGHIEIAFSCAFPKKYQLTLGYKHKNPYAFKERGFGSFSFQFQFFQSQLFRQQVDASSYPVEVYLNQMMFMQIKTSSAVPHVELFVESCKATPENDPNSRISYPIIENGCVKDSTVQVYHSSNNQFRFGMAAFEFIGDYNEVYITCSVLLCESDIPNTRCSQGCIQPGSHRGRREAASQTSRHLISQGPLRLASMNKVLVTGPSGIKSTTIATGDYVIRWTPTDNEMNDHFPVCFVAEAYDRYRRVFHSELRCVTVDVGHYEAVVTCNETTMKVEVEKTYFLRRHEDSLRLRSSDTSSECNLKTLSNSTHLVAVMSLDSCGTYVEEDKDNILYRNGITSADPNKTISRNADVDIAFLCAFPKKNNVTLGFKHKNPYAFKERGFGSFSFQFEFFQSQLFRQQVDASTYPVEVNLDQMMFMQIEATSSMPDVELFVESCKATPEDKPNSRISYPIIENGCVKDSTMQVYPSSKNQFRLGMVAFEFIGANNEVYITCSVILCEIGIPNTRCSQGCIQPGSYRRRREAASETSRHLISQGPLRLARSLDSPSGRSAPFLNLNLGLNVVLVAGCLLIVGVVVYRSRRSKAKYQPLPTSDSE